MGGSCRPLSFPGAGMFPIRDTIRSRSVPIITYALITLNLLVFLFQSSLTSQSFTLFIQNFGLTPAQFSLQNPFGFFTLFSSMFMHGSWFHVISNMWILFIFGDNVEDRMGSFRYLVFYLLAGVFAALTHVYFAPRLALPTVGASGAVAGVLGAYFLLFPRARVLTFIPLFIFPWFIDIPALIFLGVWFLSQLANGLMFGGVAMEGIAWWAHIGGFLFGFVTARLFIPRRRLPAPTRKDPWTYR
jgi:membrane associated rhomboid family serine protease